MRAHLWVGVSATAVALMAGSALACPKVPLKWEGATPSAVEKEVTGKAPPAGAYHPDTPHLAYFHEDHHKLVLYLHGHGGAAGSGSVFLQRAAARGFHAIALGYVTDFTESCGSAPACFGALHEEIFDGKHPVPGVITVGVQNSIQNRLRMLLRYLIKKYPAQHWDQFLSGDEVTWDKVTLVGHSLGAGESGWIGRHHKVERVLMFSGTPDAATTDKGDHLPSAWVPCGATSATPCKAYFGLAHTNDMQGDRIKRILPNWKAMGMDGAGTVSVDNHAPTGQELLTSLAPGNGDPAAAHMQTVAASATPMKDGCPVYGPVWDYMLGAP